MKRSELKTALEALSKKHDGHLSPELIIEAAREPASELHLCFDWNDSSAAHKHRLTVARSLIRAIKIEVRTETHNFPNVTAYVHNPALTNQEQGYVSLESANRETKRAILLDDLERLLAQIGRTQKIAAAVMPTIVSDLDNLSNVALTIVSRVKRAKDKITPKMGA